jgi:hypothetical protein
MIGAQGSWCLRTIRDHSWQQYCCTLKRSAADPHQLLQVLLIEKHSTGRGFGTLTMHMVMFAIPATAAITICVDGGEVTGYGNSRPTVTTTTKEINRTTAVLMSRIRFRIRPGPGPPETIRVITSIATATRWRYVQPLTTLVMIPGQW